MKKDEYIVVGNLARLRSVQSIMFYLIPQSKAEFQEFDDAQKTLRKWARRIEKRLRIADSALDE